MPLSNVLGAQSLVQPAVCTTSTRPASPYTGQAIYDTTTASQLIWNGTAWTGTGGLQLVTTATCSSGGTAVGGVVTIGSAVSSVTVATAFSSTYDNYLIVVSGGVGSATSQMELTLGSTTTGYYRFGTYGVYSSAVVNGLSGSNTGSWGDVVGISANSLSGIIELIAPNLAKRTSMSSSMQQTATAGYALRLAGFLDNATQYTAFTLTVASGTVTGGTIKVYGYQNS